jgi:hypothetical protein
VQRVYVAAEPTPDPTADLFGSAVHVLSGTTLGGGW